uniref:SCP domain-containing protein n=1 Tax=Romanomermis culicivorax TaxID=13658 RepID=A0A915J0M5_ROMCU
MIIEEHNALRRQEFAANMQEMVWNEDLAEMAAGVVSRCKADHSEWNSRVGKSGFAYSGESIFWAWVRWNMTAVVRNLHDEKPHYRYLSNTCHLRDNSALTDCGHYTQIVWAKTCSVGCAYSFCDYIINGGNITSGFMVVCKYGPGLDYNP